MRIKLIVLLISISISSLAQNHWVFFKDKCSDNLDYFKTPICESYINQLQSLGVDILDKSIWLNAVVVKEDQLNLALKCDFISASRTMGTYNVIEESINEDFKYGEGDWQVEILGLDSLHRLGYTGKGIKVAVFDGGFYNLDSIPGFDSLWLNNQILASYDFVKDSLLSFKESPHGMQVMSLLGANDPDSLVGAAPGANFLLARTEKTGSEEHREELNWIKAMEWADAIGVDIIHSSLGYSQFDSLQGDYSYLDMDGETTIITLATDVAASRGIFVTNSAGNQGNDPWRYITAPCDGKNVLCIGAVDSFRQKAEFSSFGPSVDGRVKPDVMAMGVRNTIYETNGTLRRGSGTSFSGPIMAGAVACLMQAHPSSTNRQLYEAIIKSSDKYTQPDSAYGYGIPDLLKVDSLLSKVLAADDIEELTVHIFPNPASISLTIVCEPGSLYRIVDTKGTTVKEGKFLNWYNFLDTQLFNNETYYITISYNYSIYTERIIIQH